MEKTSRYNHEWWAARDFRSIQSFSKSDLSVPSMWYEGFQEIRNSIVGLWRLKQADSHDTSENFVWMRLDTVDKRRHSLTEMDLAVPNVRNPVWVT